MSSAGLAATHLGALPDPLEVEPLVAPPAANVAVPGSKSLTNRALVCAALAEGTSELSGILLSDDTGAMLTCLDGLGVSVEVDPDRSSARVVGAAGRLANSGAVLDARLSGTTSRFVAPLAVLGSATAVLDGSPPLRARPMADLFDVLEALGAAVTPLGEAGHLPVQLDGGRGGVRGGRVEVRGDASSQFLSGLLLAAPAMPSGLEVEVTSELVSRPYVEMTIAVMRRFGAVVDHGDDLRHIAVAGSGYTACRLQIEPDASAASYFFAAAAACGGRVRVEGLGNGSLQGDVAFVDVLAEMGATVRIAADRIEVEGPAQLRGVSVDMADISDTAQTLAAIAPLADGPTTVTGIGFIRGKETDRIAAVVRELRRLGIDAMEEPDGFTVHPGRPVPAVVQTYDDHRMAMSFAVLGLAAPGVSIADPACVAKTFPGFWAAVDRLRRPVAGTPVDLPDGQSL